MFEVGDVVLHDLYVGVINDTIGDNVICSCSDGNVRTFSNSDVALMSKYTDVLQILEGAILKCV